MKPTYHIGTVAKLTGVSTHTLRVWERRYGAVEPERSPGGTREYSDADIEKLTCLKALVDAGHSIGQIAHLPMSELRPLLDAAKDRGLTNSGAASVQDSAVHRFLDALEVMELDAAERVLHDVGQVLDPPSLVFDVIAPITAEIGNRWADGRLRIAHEHAATALLRNFLGSFLRNQPTRSDAPVAAITTLSGELHELGALMSAFVSTVRGWQTVYLGPNLPVGEIVHVVETTNASLLLLSLVNARDDSSANQLRDLQGACSPETHIWVGGRSAAAYADLLGPDQLVGDLHDLYRRLGQPLPASRRRRAEPVS
jgi:DNA-binding transcriptional MerR regulator